MLVWGSVSPLNSQRAWTPRLHASSFPKGSIYCPFKDSGSKDYTWYGVWAVDGPFGLLLQQWIPGTFGVQEASDLLPTDLRSEQKYGVDETKPA